MSLSLQQTGLDLSSVRYKNCTMAQDLNILTILIYLNVYHLHYTHNTLQPNLA